MKGLFDAGHKVGYGTEIAGVLGLALAAGAVNTGLIALWRIRTGAATGKRLTIGGIAAGLIGTAVVVGEVVYLFMSALQRFSES